MRDSCLQSGAPEGRVVLRLSPPIAALLLDFHSRECDSPVEVTMLASRVRRLQGALAAHPGPSPPRAPSPLALSTLDAAVAQALAGEAQAGPRDPGSPDLTAREREVLTALAAGDSYAEIARDMVIDVETVRSHAKRIRRKLGVSASSQLRGWTDTKVVL